MAKQNHTTTYSSDLLLITRYVKQSQLKTHRSNARRFRTRRSRDLLFRTLIIAKR